MGKPRPISDERLKINTITRDTRKNDEESKKTLEPVFGLSKVRTIMKSTADTGLIQTESLYVMTKATELFIQYLARNAYRSTRPRILKYEHLSKLVEEQDNLEFLQQIIPKKITVKQYKELIAECQDESDISSGSESESAESITEEKK